MSTGPLTVGTAGHVDHGKTALVFALTGRDTDRLPEERARGLTIAPGFAPLDLPSGRRLSLVDVPGHERFVRHMIAGASGVDAYLLCVAADDGVMPQTREHVDVLALLGVATGVVAITRADRADPGPAAAAARALVGPGPAIVPVCAPRGEGIDALRAALDAATRGLSRRTAPGPARLHIDRAFSVAGAGTVVTGTHWGSPLRPGDRVRLLPGGAEGRVRAIQAHDRPVEQAAGGRVALALAGVERADAPRGACVVARADGPAPVDALTVDLTWLAAAGAPLRSRRRLELYLGTAHRPAFCRLLDAERIEPGACGRVRLRLSEPLVACPGDRVVVRSAERRTVGGGIVRAEQPAVPGPAPTRAAPPPVRASVAPELVARVAALLADAGLRPPPPAELPGLTGAGAADCGAALAEARAAGRAVESEGLWFAPEALARARVEAVELLRDGPRPIGALRDRWGVGRRHAMALAAHLDAAGVTRRVGDLRALRRGSARVITNH